MKRKKLTVSNINRNPSLPIFNIFRRVNEATRQRKRRAKLKESIRAISEKHQDAAEVFRSLSRDVVGRPRLDVDQPYLLSTIVDIVQSSSASADRRRSEMLRTITTLDDLNKELLKLGFNISRSATYLRLLPRRQDSIEGKRHVKTVPVKHSQESKR